MLLHPLADNVITYVTFTGDGVVFTNVSVIDELLPLPAILLIPPTDARVQLKVVPVVALVAV